MRNGADTRSLAIYIYLFKQNKTKQTKTKQQKQNNKNQQQHNTTTNKQIKITTIKQTPTNAIKEPLLLIGKSSPCGGKPTNQLHLNQIVLPRELNDVWAVNHFMHLPCSDTQ